MADMDPAKPLTQGCSAHLVSEVRKISGLALSDRVVARARHAVLDWVGVTISGARQPSAQVTRQVMLAEGGKAGAVAIGTADRMTARQAALFGGIASHSQDFDDMGLGVHPSVVVAPAIFALADELDAGGKAVLDALLQGYEALKIINAAVGESSYARGFHCTGTFGAFGAAIASARMLGLDEGKMLSAFGTAGMLASGLRAGFGNMGKHLNSGNAAAAGVLAARLAESGFVGPTDVLESPVGFANAVNAPDAKLDPENPRARLQEQLAVEEIIFKLHAACGGTHSAIDGIRQIRNQRPFDLDEVEDVELIVPELLPTICGIVEPTKGTEGMFSIHYTSALALTGSSTGTDAFTDERVADPLLARARQLVRLTLEPGDFAAMKKPVGVNLRLKSGETLTAAVNIFEPRTDLDGQWADLVAKFNGLVVPILGQSRADELVEMIGRFETLESLRPLTALTMPHD